MQLKSNIPEEILLVFHNDLNYDHHFIIKKLAKKFDWEFNCLGENTEEYKTLSVPVTEEVKRIDKSR